MNAKRDERVLSRAKNMVRVERMPSRHHSHLKRDIHRMRAAARRARKCAEARRASLPRVACVRRVPRRRASARRVVARASSDPDGEASPRGAS